jgi:hypothetical protein
MASLERKLGFSRFVYDLALSARDFLGAAPNSLKHHLNKEELARVTLTSLGAGSGIYGLLQAIVLSAGLIFPAPIDAALAATILAAILEVLRRLDHGDGTATAAHRPRTCRRKTCPPDSQ